MRIRNSVAPVSSNIMTGVNTSGRWTGAVHAVPETSQNTAHSCWASASRFAAFVDSVFCQGSLQIVRTALEPPFLVVAMNDAEHGVGGINFIAQNACDEEGVTADPVDFFYL